MYDLHTIIRMNDKRAKEMAETAAERRLARQPDVVPAEKARQPVLICDEVEAALVAKLLSEINPGRPNSLSSILASCHANIAPGSVTVLSTAGWMASCYLNDQGDTVVRFSLCAYSVACYLNEGKTPYDNTAKFHHSAM